MDSRKPLLNVHDLRVLSGNLLGMLRTVANVVTLA